MLGVLFLAPLAQAESNVEPELCFMKIKHAIEAGSDTGRFELSDPHCAKYKLEYDRKYGDPSRPRLKGELEFQENISPQIDKSQIRDACWDALSASGYSQKTYKENASCRTFMERDKMEKCLKFFDQIYLVDGLLEAVSQEEWRDCQSYDYRYLKRIVR